MKKLTLFIEDDVLVNWKRLLHYQDLADFHLDEVESKEMKISTGDIGVQLMKKIIDYVERKEKIFHLVTEVN